jgi:hypothetical protein
MEELYAAFLNRIESDIYELSLVPAENEWIYAEWKQFFLSSIQLFKFPRASFDLDAENNFIDSKINNSEIQILAGFMRYFWICQQVDSWENIKTQYSESDFSQANILKELQNLKKTSLEEARYAESLYYRSLSGKPYDYGALVGKQ